MSWLLQGERGWNVSFGGCGFLGVYHVGAAACLQERAPRLLRDARRVYGASAGALAGAVIVGGCSLAESCVEVLSLAKEARKHNLGPLHPSFNMMKILRESLNKTLLENSHELLSGKFYISLTRVSDGENVLISHFNSKEEVVQALLCSSFLPIYCGLIPPTFRGVRYVDGGLSDNLPHHFSKDTITISPFSAECDICPKFHCRSLDDMIMLNASTKLNLWNVYRISQAVFPPEPKELVEICEQGYSDALKFLKESGLLQESVFTDLALRRQDHQGPARFSGYTDKKIAANGDKKEMQEEVFIDQLKLASGPLDKTTFEKLPPSLHKALLEACKEKSGLCAQLSKFLPVRLISYMMLPYTLPVASACSLAVRLVSWFPDIPEDMRWMQGQLYQTIGTIYCKAKKSLLNTAKKESGTLLRMCQTAPVLHSSCCPRTLSLPSTNLTEWPWGLPCCENLAEKGVALSDPENRGSIASFFLNLGKSGGELGFGSSLEKSIHTASED